MKGCPSESPGCVHSPEAMAERICTLGFLPLFSNAVPGFSVEETVPPHVWWTGDPRSDPWEWRQILSRDSRLAYGKFFDRKAGFISRDWFPVFANARRDGYDFDTLCDDGLASHRSQKLMAAFDLAEDGTGRALLSPVLREEAGFGKGREKNFEGTLTELQMQSYLLVGDFRQRLNRRGEGYGWHLALLETPESKWGYDFVTSAYREAPAESWARIRAQVLRCFPRAEEAAVDRLLGYRAPGARR